MAFAEATRLWFFYKITNPNGRIYIGKTANIKKRESHYRSNKDKNQRLIYNSIKKYGWDNHRFEVIDKLIGNVSDSDDKEMFWIRTYMSFIKAFPEEKGLNLTIGGGGCVGNKWTDEQRQKMSIAKKSLNFKHSEEAKAKIANAGKGNKYNLGRLQTKEWKKNLSQRMIGNKYNVGRKLSVSHLKAIDDARYKSFKPIIQIDSIGHPLTEFESMTQASNKLGVPITLISRVLKGKQKQTNGFYFKFK